MYMHTKKRKIFKHPVPPPAFLIIVTVSRDKKNILLLEPAPGRYPTSWLKGNRGLNDGRVTQRQGDDRSCSHDGQAFESKADALA